MEATKKDEIIKLSFPKSAVFSSIPRTTIQAIGDRLRLSEDQIADLKLAVGEACTNAIKFGDEGSAEVCVLYKIRNDSIEIQVRNSGQPFIVPNPPKNEATIAELREGGLGLFLISNLMDEISIECAFGETAVTMVKRLDPDSCLHSTN
jgi:serine/threonine-protein kinase RsbW